MPNDENRADDSAAKRAHGTQGRGHDEALNEPSQPLPDEAEGQHTGSAGWGSEQSGGSVIDKRTDHSRG